MAEVSINIGANTQEANAQINQLNQSLGKTGAAADVANKSNEELDKTLAKQESTIKIIDGAVNLLGGSVELLAGALVLSGAASEEQAKEFEAAALGAIAFADGAKRTVDGVKSLNEGLKSYGGIAGAARKAQLALNTAILANPYIAAASALAILVAGIAFFVTRSNEAEDAQKKLNDEIARGATADADYADLQVRLAKARGEDTVAIKKREIAAREDRIEALRASEDAEEDSKKRIAFSKERIKLQQDQKVARVDLTTAETQAAEKAKENSAKALEDQKAANKAARDARLEAEGNRQVIKLLGDEFIASLNKADKFYDGQRFKIEEVETDLEEFTFFTQQQLDEFNKAQAFSTAELLQVQLTSITRYYDELIKQAGDNAVLTAKLEEAKQKAITKATEEGGKERGALGKFFESEAAKNISATLATTALFAKTLSDVQDDTTKEGFEKSKKFKIAEVVTSALQASFQAFGTSLSSFPAPLGAILGAVQVAAIAIASKKAISGIQSAQFGGGTPSLSAPSSGGGSGAAALPISPSFGAGGFLGQPQGTLTPITSPQTPLRAYVVSADVTNGQQANAQITRRRTLGPG